MLFHFPYPFQDLGLGAPLRIDGDLHAGDDRDQDPLQDEVYDGHRDEGEEGLIGAAAHQVAHLRKVHNGDVADDGSFLNEGDDVVLVDRQEVLRCLGQQDLEEALGVTVAQRLRGLRLASVHRVVAHL